MMMPLDRFYSNVCNALQLPLLSEPKKKPTRVRFCQRCKNHQEYYPVKFHKKKCPNRNCVCAPCLETANRQREMSKQIAERRSKEQDLERLKLNNGNGTSSSEAATTGKKEELNAEKIEELLTCSVGLIMQYKYPVEALSLVYLLLKAVKADVNSAIQHITMDISEA